MSAWTDHVAKWEDCTACPLCQQRDRIVLARGTVPCDVLFVGEAPGASEDAIGLPFVGPAGDLLQRIIDRALPPETTYALTNLVCCFPREAKGRGDNEPEHDEILACRPRLVEFVRLCRPRLIVLVGQIAKQNVYGAAMFRLDGESEQPEWIPEGKFLEFVDIVHPAAIVRMPLAQKQMAAQKCEVVLRRAVENVVQSGKKFTNWRDNHAGQQVQSNADDIPF